MAVENLKDTIITLKEGRKEKNYKLKCKFYSEETGKEYWIYSDEEQDEDGCIELKVSSVSKKEDAITLVSCTDPDELRLVVNMYEALKQRVNICEE